MFRGRVVAIYTAPEKGAPMQSRDDVAAVDGAGLDGDRYATGAGKYTDRAEDGKRAVTLIEREAVAAAGREYEVEIGEHETRRNVVTEGVPLNHLVGRTFRVGDVTLHGLRLAEPCAYLEGLTRPGVRRALVHRAGLRAEIVEGGTLRVGDPIEVAQPNGEVAT
ncbi:MAG TPA: MOSC domain-containing protein [Acidimicrobiia bacterium]|nr:MOSC domain-containing protein [Acidimicrobiia bacterium]